VAALLCAFVASARPSQQAAAGGSEGTVYYNAADKSYRLVMGKADLANGAAVGYWFDNIQNDGWGRLTVKSNPAFDDYVQTFAGGYFEGATTWTRIYDHYVNIYSSFFGNLSAPIPPGLKGWLNTQDQWSRKQVSSQGPTNPYWGQVGAIIAQFDGLVAGYNAYATPDKKLEPMAFTVLNGVGDLLDLTNAFRDEIKPHRPQHSHMTSDDWRDWIYNTHCSAIIKVTGDLSDIFAGHTSWFWYAAMLRIAKTYEFPLKNPYTAAKKVTFSSYPGFLESLDDFYITDQELVVIETSNGIFNDSLYELVRNHPNVLLSWQRTLLANRVSTSGDDWASTYARYNSGTYNNQWLILDNKRFQPGVGLLPGTLTIAEQIPGTVEFGDQTNILEKGYWPSYNVPFYPYIFNTSGYVQHVSDQPIMLSYQTCCRANIFRRDQGAVDSLESFKHILRYNDWQKDPYSQGDPGYSISSRFDLEKKPHLMGGIDTKVTSHRLIKSLTFEAINGPTYQQQPVFEWTQEFASTQHVGQPQRFDFPFVTMVPHAF